MEILVNNKPHQFENAPSIEQLMTTLDIQIKKGIAIAVNDTIIHKEEWTQYQLVHQDKILIITATQGG